MFKIQENFEILICFFGNVFINNLLKNFVLGSLNAEFCYIPCYSKEKIDC